jgi:hypothetical protein
VSRLWREAEANEKLERGGGFAELPDRMPHLQGTDHVQHRPELSELNRRYLLPGPIDPSLPEGSGPWARLKRHIVRLAKDVVHSMLDHYLAEERELLTHLIRFQNELAKKCDRLEDELRAVAGATRAELGGVKEAARSELEALKERMAAFHLLLEERIDRLETRG